MSEAVRQMFSQIAGTYDLLNDLLSLGIHRSWKRTVVRKSGVRVGMRVLDCACGTGDLAFAFKRAVGDPGLVVGTDFCGPMVGLARQKAATLAVDVGFRVEDALRLSDRDGEYDAASISFGIRNVDDPVACLREMARVVKPGGRVLVLEFGQPTGWWGWLYRFYSRSVLPFLGRLLSRNRSAYEYLPRTASLFPCREAFLGLMDEAGCFSSSAFTSLSGGIDYVYQGTVR